MKSISSFNSRPPPKRRSFNGRRFDMLKVVGDAPDSMSGKRRFKVRCDCGNTFISFMGNLSRVNKSGLPRSCGCAKGGVGGDAN